MGPLLGHVARAPVEAARRDGGPRGHRGQEEGELGEPGELEEKWGTRGCEVGWMDRADD